ncbi:MAG: 1-(5-phosphoribosyl)-5-[(5-phosphoribosylamino)methylideneamino]imidazole-4-carboxamide isomerase [Acutalibacteraceae bacterium]|jgi:phosphoribosylformimino-5-aminoimidazole carboxamide ribotide isomerase
MNIFPAIDLFDGKAVRLYKGDYQKMTVYSENPLEIARDFENKGANFIHIVDLEGAKTGSTENFETIKQIAGSTSLFTEVGGGIRTIKTVDTYLQNGVDRVILGTAAVEDEEFLKTAVRKYGERIAVGVDIKDGFVAIKGWTQNSRFTCFDFCKKMEDIGVKYIICTDISRDGAMQGTNRLLYKELSESFNLNIIASGGVSSIEDIKALRELNLYGAIIGKAYYIGAIDLVAALEAAK